MTHTTIVRRRQRRLGFGSLWLLIGFGLILLLAGCGSGGSSNGTGGNGTGPGGNDTPSCDVNVATGDCDNDGVVNSEDEFPEDASRSCTVTDGNRGTTADCDNDGVANDADVDDDNDGLIEIATATELDNVRHNLMGTSYDDEEADTSPGDAGDDTGCPSTGGCTGYELSADIDLTSIDNWQPIGPSNAESFRANFDGNDFRVSNMVIDTDAGNSIGLFGTVGSSSQTITIRNLHVSGSIVYSSADTNARIGGLIGRMSTSGGLVDGCSSAVAITGGGGTNQRIGGLVGFAFSEIRNSWATGAVYSCGGNTTDDEGSCEPTGCTCEGGGFIGGLAGSSATVTNSYATGDVRGNGAGFNQSVGGLLGNNGNSPTEDSYATGAVVGGREADILGGLVGTAFGAVVRSYATGTVDDGDNDMGAATADSIGGLIGRNITSMTSSDNYYSGMVGAITDGGVSDDGDRVSNAGDAVQIMRSTPAALQGTTTNDGIYSAWSASDWDFGGTGDFPALKSTEGELLCGQPEPRVQCP